MGRALQQAWIHAYKVQDNRVELPLEGPPRWEAAVHCAKRQEKRAGLGGSQSEMALRRMGIMG